MTSPHLLLDSIEAAVTLKSGGITATELAATDLHNLKMKRGEDITGYAIRPEGLVEAIAHSGVAKTHLPTPPAQAMKFIDGLDIEVDSYRHLTAHCENSLSIFGVDVYPTTLPDALRFASKYKQMTSTKDAKPEIAVDTMPVATALMAGETTGMKMGKKTGKAVSGDTRSVPKTPTDADDDDDDEHSWKKKIHCRACGVKGHIDKECPEKIAFQEFVAQRKTPTKGAMHYTAFTGFGKADEDTDDFIPYENLN